MGKDEGGREEGDGAWLSGVSVRVEVGGWSGEVDVSLV